MNKTKVVFRKFKDGSIVALFPDEIVDPLGSIASYQHVGQHGAAHYSHCIYTSVPATPKEQQALRQELENMGYKLEVKKRK